MTYDDLCRSHGAAAIRRNGGSPEHRSSLMAWAKVTQIPTAAHIVLKDLDSFSFFFETLVI